MYLRNATGKSMTNGKPTVKNSPKLVSVDIQNVKTHLLVRIWTNIVNKWFKGFWRPKRPLCFNTASSLYLAYSSLVKNASFHLN